MRVFTPRPQPDWLNRLERLMPDKRKVRYQYPVIPRPPPPPRPPLVSPEPIKTEKETYTPPKPILTPDTNINFRRKYVYRYILHLQSLAKNTEQN